MAYNIELHSHRFAVWAAHRAASRGVRGLTSNVGQTVLEACGFNEQYVSTRLPDPCSFDDEHRAWRNTAVDCASDKGCEIQHGVAAKLINTYLKSRFVCGESHDDPKISALHPPIDRRLLHELARVNFGGNSAFWTQRRDNGWRAFGSCEYEDVVNEIRRCLSGRPLWEIEEHWSPTP
jgi:hypothetical protein